jgi:adenylate cyclase
VALRLEPLDAHVDELFRVLGNSLTRVAEAAVSLYAQTVEPTMDTPDPDFLKWVMSVAQTTSLGLQLGDSMGAIFAHHLGEAIERQRAAQSDVMDRTLFRLAVGFVDLVGFTPLSQHADPADLLSLIGEFEARAFDVAVAHHGRIVKHIGDEVMFVALDAEAGCAIAHELTSVCAEGIEPRGGVAFGDVVTRHGDYYGSVVNLAARLAELAIPREVLVDGRAVSEAKGGAFEFEPAGHRLLKGFDQPSEVFSVVASS